MSVFSSVPPSEPQNLRVEEVTSSSFRICWDEPVYHGSPYLAGYNISYNDKYVTIEVLDCYSFEANDLEWGQIYDITISAFSKGGNKTVAGSELIFIMGKTFSYTVDLSYT